MTVYSSGAPDLTAAARPSLVTLMSMAQDLLAMTEQAANEDGVELPARRVIYMAPMPADCPQVAVLIGGWTAEPELDGMVHCFRAVWTAQLGVVITRKTPAIPKADGDLPAPSQLMRAAEIASADAEVLLKVVGGLSTVADVLVETPAAEGGLQSTTLAFRASAVGGL